jgi:uncharacterized membrane protein
MFDNPKEYVGVDDEQIYISTANAQPAANVLSIANAQPVHNAYDSATAHQFDENAFVVDDEVDDVDPLRCMYSMILRIQT